jgi:hypothetical protein
MKTSAIVIVVMVAGTACMPYLNVKPEVIPRDRASRELACPLEQLDVASRTDIELGLFDVRGCGRVARYWCRWSLESKYCVREPNPDPSEEEARRRQTLPVASPRS